MATIRKRGAYQWEAQIRRRGYKAQSKTFTTKAEADAWANMIESEMSRGIWVSRAEAEATTLHEALERYEIEILPAKKGIVQEKSVIRLWKATDLAKRPLAGIRSTNIAEQRDGWLETCKPASVLRRLAVLSHLFNVARKEWGMESLGNPVGLVRKPQPHNARTRRVVTDAPQSNGNGGDTTGDERKSNGELERVAAASESPILPAIIWLAVETAMRRGEIIDLQWENIDLDRRVAHLPETKNGTSRDVPLSSRAVAVLQGLKDARNQSSDNGTKDGAMPPIGPVFAVHADAVTRAFERAVARARKAYLKECQKGEKKPDDRFLTNLRFHDLRHEATSRLAEIFAMHELTKITGHKDPRMLMRYYHPKAEDLARKLT